MSATKWGETHTETWTLTEKYGGARVVAQCNGNGFVLEKMDPVSNAQARDEAAEIEHLEGPELRMTGDISGRGFHLSPPHPWGPKSFAGVERCTRCGLERYPAIISHRGEKGLAYQHRSGKRSLGAEPRCIRNASRGRR